MPLQTTCDFKNLVESRNVFIDNTGWLDRLNGLGNVFYGENGCGKSTILSMLQYYFDERLHSKELFEHLHCEKSRYFYGRMNRYPVISISFADFNAPDYESALWQVERIMAEAYTAHTEEVLEKSYDIDGALRILEGTASETDLLKSLDTILYALRRYEDGTKIRPVVLIDDYTNLLKISRKNGYKDKMLSFCKEWLPHQLNNYTEYFAITGEVDLEENRGKRWENDEFYNCQEDVFAESAFDHFNKRYMMLTPEQIRAYCRDHGLDGVEIYLDAPENRRKIAEEYNYALRDDFWNIRSRQEDMDILYPIGLIRKINGATGIAGVCHMEKRESNSCPCNRQGNVPGESGMEKWIPPEALKVKIEEKKEWLLQKGIQEKIEREKSIRRHFEDYAAPLPPDVILSTPFAGIRVLPQLPHNAQYNHLTAVVKNLYDVYKEDPQQRLYEIMQEVNEEHNLRLNAQELLEWNALEETARDRWLSVDTKDYTDSYWYYVKAMKDSRHYEIGPMYIKVTISVSGCRPGGIFIAAVRELLENGEHEFQAKLTKYERRESMVFWLKNSEFFLLEACMKQYDDYLIQRLPFAAYRGKLGVSRDLYGVGSHHSVQGELLENYFKLIKERDEISIENMYQYLLDSWNDVLPGKDGKDLFSRTPYVTWDAQMLVILLESLFVILGERKITDEHIFLNNEKLVWHALGNGRCWKEVGEIWRNESLRKVPGISAGDGE